MKFQHQILSWYDKRTLIRSKLTMDQVACAVQQDPSSKPALEIWKAANAISITISMLKAIEGPVAHL